MLYVHKAHSYYCMCTKHRSNYVCKSRQLMLYVHTTLSSVLVHSRQLMLYVHIRDT